MAKIKVEIEALDDKYCDTIDSVCPMCREGFMGVRLCALFGVALDNELTDNSYRSKRCDECKQAEVEE